MRTCVVLLAVVVLCVALLHLSEAKKQKEDGGGEVGKHHRGGYKKHHHKDRRHEGRQERQYHDKSHKGKHGKRQRTAPPPTPAQATTDMDQNPERHPVDAPSSGEELRGGHHHPKAYGKKQFKGKKQKPQESSGVEQGKQHEQQPKQSNKDYEAAKKGYPKKHSAVKDGAKVEYAKQASKRRRTEKEQRSSKEVKQEEKDKQQEQQPKAGDVDTVAPQEKTEKAKPEEIPQKDAPATPPPSAKVAPGTEKPCPNGKTVGAAAAANQCQVDESKGTSSPTERCPQSPVPIGDACRAACACPDRTVCFALSGKQSGVCKTPQPDDLTRGVYLK